MQDSHRLSSDEKSAATGSLFADITKIPAAQSLVQRVEAGGAQTFSGITASAQPFFAALLRQFFPQRSIVIVTENLKRQESFQQDLETWLQSESKVGDNQLSTFNSQLFFYPAWEVLPHESKLPHADVISDRLQTLIALAGESKVPSANSKVIVANVSALLQKTFTPDDLKSRTRKFNRGDKIAPLDLIEFLEEQGYEPEAQVSQKGEIALRGGIVDIFQPTNAWPVRLEFFGDELESLRHFDPLTQISREEISEIILPPAGELGLLKSKVQSPEAKDFALATLLDHLPPETIFVLCEPESLAVHADNYEQQIPKDDPFFISWPDFLVELNRRGLVSVELLEDPFPLTPALSRGERENRFPLLDETIAGSGSIDLQLSEGIQPLFPLPGRGGAG